MNLREALLTKTKVGDLVLLKVDGWQVGCTMIDNEDLFIGSLNDRMLLTEVLGFRYEKRDWTTKDVMIIDI